MPIKLNVPFNQKDETKKLGAIWIPDVKIWAIPDNHWVNQIHSGLNTAIKSDPSSIK
ncbi:DUF5710 domain-containing protein [Chitinophaga sp. CC14]|uniref:DUF5710 domain-containing protein n=1 Tax=Chitinophaga sp. CC14 TaxID=3029199 RepID=UPI003B982C16